jgi:hypothetical protein
MRPHILLLALPMLLVACMPPSSTTAPTTADKTPAPHDGGAPHGDMATTAPHDAAVMHPVTDGAAPHGDLASPYGPCTIGSQEGTCVDTHVMGSCPGPTMAGYCPGPDNIECCLALPSAPAGGGTEGVGTSCSVGGKAGTCVDTHTAGSCGAPTVPGFCPGPDNVECCLVPAGAKG